MNEHDELKQIFENLKAEHKIDEMATFSDLDIAEKLQKNEMMVIRYKELYYMELEKYEILERKMDALKGMRYKFYKFDDDKDQFAISVIVYGDVDRNIITKQAEEIRKILLNDKHIDIVNIDNKEKRMILIEIDPIDLSRYEISLDSISNNIRDSSLNYTAGSLKSSSGDLLVKIEGNINKIDELITGDLLTRPICQP